MFALAHTVTTSSPLPAQLQPQRRFLPAALMRRSTAQWRRFSWLRSDAAPPHRRCSTTRRSDAAPPHRGAAPLGSALMPLHRTAAAPLPAALPRRRHPGPTADCCLLHQLFPANVERYATCGKVPTPNACMYKYWVLSDCTSVAERIAELPMSRQLSGDLRPPDCGRRRT
ncbi:hypothetical protein EYF80_009616 [Liparis tanakae]|uniref:Uncharacterized protein n=1 Tax=Liparis tanakae TaxID=230148 RepID=A0A4Z2IQB5_9TELE|nr:hypothetical protein EYF80_009616 [Liparis tanakae]